HVWARVLASLGSPETPTRLEPLFLGDLRLAGSLHRARQLGTFARDAVGVLVQRVLRRREISEELERDEDRHRAAEDHPEAALALPSRHAPKVHEDHVARP